MISDLIFAAWVAVLLLAGDALCAARCRRYTQRITQLEAEIAAARQTQQRLNGETP